MNRLVRFCATLAIAVSVSSCLVKSIHPICASKDSILVPGLIGTWQDAKGEITVIIAKSSGNTYRVVYLDKEKPAVFSGRVARLGGKMFMDLFPVSGDGNNNLQNLSIMSAHMVFKAEQEKDRLFFSYLDTNWLNESLKSGKVKLACERRIEEASNEKDPYVELILTASTKELSDFLTSNARNEKAFVKPMELKGIK